MTVTATTAGVAADTANCGETVGSKLKDPLLDSATKVCGLPTNHKWRPETWWWNEQVDEAIQEVHAYLKAYKPWKREARQLRPRGRKSPTMTPSTWQSMPSEAKSEAEKEEFATVCPDGVGVFRVAKHMEYTNQDVIGENCVRNNAGELALIVKDKMKAWVEHFARLLNVEFEWPSNELPEVPSNQQDEMWQGCWPFWHHSWDAESCWWWRS